MKEIRVNTAFPYTVYVDRGLLGRAGDFARKTVPAAETVMVVTDDTVDALYGRRVRESLRTAGLRVCTFVVPHGETSKNAENYLRILNELAEKQVTRSDLIIALGGGVVGDLAGFSAATYMRGIPLIQMPTTLLAQVDASVGGKTAIDIPAGKNLAGAFYQPAAVLCDPDALDTLPEEILTDGCAEVIKHGILRDPALFAHLKERGTGFNREYAVTRSVEIKRDVVEQDEREKGQRQLLNLGHTLAHAAEKKSGYRLTHGRAVAMGLATMARAAAKNGICTPECAAEICRTLERFGFPLTFDDSLEELYEIMLSDKKRSGNRISLVVPEEIGRCAVRSCTLEEMRRLIAPGMQA